MDNKLEIKEANFKRTLQNKLYEIYPYSSISIYQSGVTPTVTLEMFYYWKGERIGLRHEVLLIAIENYELNELIRVSVLNIQREITDRIFKRREVDNEIENRRNYFS